MDFDFVELTTAGTTYPIYGPVSVGTTVTVQPYSGTTFISALSSGWVAGTPNNGNIPLPSAGITVYLQKGEALYGQNNGTTCLVSVSAIPAH